MVILKRVVLQSHYNQKEDKVYITYKNTRVMAVTNISENYDVSEPKKITKKVLKDNRAIAQLITLSSLTKRTSPFVLLCYCEHR